MSRTLFDTPPIAINREIATALGLNAAVFLQQVHYWTTEKERNPHRYQKSFKDGYFWIYKTTKELAEEMPFLGSERTIKRMITELKNKGVLIVASHNSFGADRTNWYRVDRDAVELLARPLGQNGPTIGTKWPNGSDKMAQPIPEITAKNTTKTTANKQERAHAHDAANDSDLKNKSEAREAAEALEGLGVSPIIAEQLVIAHKPQSVIDQIEWLRFRKNISNPAAFIVKAIQQNFEPPHGSGAPTAEERAQMREIKQLWWKPEEELPRKMDAIIRKLHFDAFWNRALRDDDFPEMMYKGVEVTEHRPFRDSVELLTVDGWVEPGIVKAREFNWRGKEQDLQEALEAFDGKVR